MTRGLPLLLGLASAALFIRERRLRRAVERFTPAAFESLLAAIDANDPETGAHLRRVACYALVLAEAAGLDLAARRSVERVALFHDIGKIHAALYDLIHFNEGPLTPEERRAIATHPARGAEVLSPLSAFYPDLAEGVLAHHERWDGNGYPRGLRGEQIPVTARIVAIADAFDAITHRRRYSRGQTADEAAAAIAAGRGTQFDPELVDVFLRPPVFERVIHVHRECRRPHIRGAERRLGEREKAIPDVTFRWRDESPVQPPRDQLPQRSP